VAFDEESTSSDPGGSLNVTSVSFSHTVTAANLLIGTAGIGDSGLGANVSSVTYATIDFASVIEADDANFERAAIWKLTHDIATGANTFSVNFDEACAQSGCGVTGFTDASDTLGTPASNTAATANPTVDVESVSGDIVVSVLASDVGSGSVTTEGGTLLWEAEDVGPGDSDFSAQRQTASGTTTVCAWTSNASDWVAVGVAVKAAFKPGANAPTQRSGLQDAPYRLGAHSSGFPSELNGQAWF